MASGKASLHANCEGPFGIPLQSVLGPKTSCGVEAGTGDFLSCADMDLGVPLYSPLGSQGSSRVETCTSAFLLIYSSSVRLPIALTQELWLSFQAFSRGFPTGLSHMPTCSVSILGMTVEAV